MIFLAAMDVGRSHVVECLPVWQPGLGTSLRQYTGSAHGVWSLKRLSSQSQDLSQTILYVITVAVHTV